MNISIDRVPLAEVKPFRELFLHENNFQFVHNKCHLYGWADTYLFRDGNITLGYGSVWGGNKREDRDTIFEFYLLPPHRQLLRPVFKEFVRTSGATYIESQTNDPVQSSLLFENSTDIKIEYHLFEDQIKTGHQINGAKLEERDSGNPVDVQFLLTVDNQPAGSGGLMLNYNLPYADIYMEIQEAFRGRGLGSFLIQELKIKAYAMGRIPAARCNIRNHVSKATLLKAGFAICGYLVTGTIKPALKD